MAAVSSSVIGAPITAIILVLELTGSYDYAIAATLPVAICTFITSRTLGNSFFDKQLFSRGIEISKGREQISLNQLKILQFTEKTFTNFSIDTTVDQAIRKFKKTKTTEGYIIDKNSIFYGKINLLDIIDKKMEIKLLIINQIIHLFCHLILVLLKQSKNYPSLLEKVYL